MIVKKVEYTTYSNNCAHELQQRLPTPRFAAPLMSTFHWIKCDEVQTEYAANKKAGDLATKSFSYLSFVLFW